MDKGMIENTITMVEGKIKAAKIKTTKLQMNKSKLIVPLAAFILAVSAVTGAVGIANADTTTPSTTTNPGGPMMHKGTPPAAVGTVTAVDGESITLVDKKDNTTFVVDATSATIMKRAAPTTQGAKPTSTVITASQVAIGDMLMVQGTVSGSNIAATKIEDGMDGFGGRGGMRDGMGVQGTVTAVSGNTVTITGQNGTTYTVDATNSTVGKFETIPVSNIQVGDSVGVQGTVSGSSVTAKNIMDGMPTPVQPSATSSS